MNFLAHLFLSYPDKDEMTGNFMGDFVKGSAYEQYHEGIKRGILLHRAIDDFTDKHSLAKEAVLLLKPAYKRYAGVVCDILFDHVLAKNFSLYSDISLKSFSEECYTILNYNRHLMPPRLAFIVERVTQSRRLEQYATRAGLLNSIGIMSDNTSLPNEAEKLEELLDNKFEEFAHLFHKYFPLLQTFVKVWHKAY